MSGKKISDDYRIAWLILHRAPKLAVPVVRLLLETFHTPADILTADHGELRGLGLKQQTIAFLKQPDWKSVHADLDWLDKQENHHLVTWLDPAYPVLLQQIPDPPLVLFVAGRPELLRSVQVGIVGSRNPGPNGRQIAHRFARELASLGFTITSGLALGIDACSHRGALQETGNTVAVLGNGPDIIYPYRHGQLIREISLRGAMVTEFPPGTSPAGSNFPRRNRIISGLSAGVLVVEAALRSGSLITARFAMEQGREVFAIPGSIHNPLSRGCHDLIKQGAKLVETVRDIIEDLGPVALAGQTLTRMDIPEPDWKIDLDDDYRLLLDKVAHDPVSIDQLVNTTGLTADVVSSMLLILEVRGLVSASPGGLYIRTDPR